MTRLDLSDKELQVFGGGFARNQFSEILAKGGCGCATTSVVTDRLPLRLRADNGHLHTTPAVYTDVFVFPNTLGKYYKDDIVAHINKNGVGAIIGAVAIPNLARIHSVAINVFAEESGLTFTLGFRSKYIEFSAAKKSAQLDVLIADGDCDPTRTVSTAATSVGTITAGAIQTTNYFLFDDTTAINEDADEVVLTVASMPTSGKISGTFNLEVIVVYEAILQQRI